MAGGPRPVVQARQLRRREGRAHDRLEPAAVHRRLRRRKDAKSAQKLGQLQPFLAVLQLQVVF
jgi:hypothetical protein